jgi:hypothetical protein
MVASVEVPQRPSRSIDVLRRRTRALFGVILVAAMAAVALLARSEGAALAVFLVGGLVGGLALPPVWAAGTPILAAVLTAILDGLTADVNPGYSMPVLLLLWMALALPGALLATAGSTLIRANRTRGALDRRRRERNAG